MQRMNSLLSLTPYMPHGYCYLWNPELVGLHVSTDLLIALSYLSIPFTLAYFVRKRRDLPFHWIFLCFGILLLACGTTHAMAIWTLWHADYWTSGLIKTVTALAAVSTAIVLVKLVPQAVALPSPTELRREIAERRRAQDALSMVKTNLQIRVEERTRELQKTNADLLHEIEQREQLEQTLKESEEQLRLAQEASGLGLWDWDLRTNEVAWSAQSFRIFGFEPSARKFDLTGILAAIHADDKPAVEGAIGKALKPGGMFEAEYRIRRPDGEVRWLMSRGQTHCDDTGRLIRMIGLTLDVTERRRTAEELRRSEERFRLLVEGIADYAIYMLDPAGFVSSWNSGAERIKGYRAQEIIGHHFSCFYCAEDLRRELPGQALREAAAVGRFEEPDSWRLRKDGSRFRAHNILTSLHGQQGELIGFAKFTRDLTVSRRAEEAVQAAQAELARVIRATTLGELTASLAHEISQPLSAIINNANASKRILATSAPDLEEVRQAVTDIANAGARTGEIIARVRALLKRSTPERRPLDINQVIGEVLTLVPNVLEKHHVLVETELRSPLPPVLGDRVQLQQVLLNLIMNGIEAMNPVIDRPRVLTIRSDARESGLEVMVTDSGTGLDPSHIPHIFDTFFTTKADGMGMGLSISRSIIEAHRGRLWASPDRASQGAVFHFSLPSIG